MVVPVRNGAATIAACVEAVLGSAYPEDRRELIVVDNASTDATADILRRLSIRYAYEPRVGRAHARNRGIESSRGDYIAFTDADCVPDQAWLSQLAEQFASTGAAGVAGEIVYQPPRTPSQRFVAARYTGWQWVAMTLSEPFAITANVAFRRDVFDSVGRFDPYFVTAEDVDFGWRFFANGLQMVYAPEAIVAHAGRPTAWELFRQQESLGYGRALLRERYGLQRGYAIPSRQEVLRALNLLVRAAAAEAARGPVRPDEVSFAAHELGVAVSLRTGALRRDLERLIEQLVPAGRGGRQSECSNA